MEPRCCTSQSYLVGCERQGTWGRWSAQRRRLAVTPSANMKVLERVCWVDRCPVWAIVDLPGAVHGALTLQVQRGALLADGFPHVAWETSCPLPMNIQILIHRSRSTKSENTSPVLSCCAACFEALLERKVSAPGNSSIQQCLSRRSFAVRRLKGSIKQPAAASSRFSTRSRAPCSPAARWRAASHLHSAMRTRRACAAWPGCPLPAAEPLQRC